MSMIRSLRSRAAKRRIRQLQSHQTLAIQSDIINPVKPIRPYLSILSQPTSSKAADKTGTAPHQILSPRSDLISSITPHQISSTSSDIICPIKLHQILPTLPDSSNPIRYYQPCQSHQISSTPSDFLRI